MARDAGPGRPGPFVYLDYAATAPLRAEVAAAMAGVGWGNPSGLHSVARQSRERLEEARSRVAATMSAETVVFTSGGSEAANLAVMGLARGHRSGGRHVLVSSVEHPSVLEAAARLAREGFEVSQAPVDRFGRVDLEALESLLRPDTVLVSIMTANNEVGTLQPVEAAAELLARRGILLHCDAVQTGWAPQQVDCVTFSAHKLGGPAGVGCLCLRRRLDLDPVVLGGAQEDGLRAGTQNVAAAVGAAEALALWTRELEAQTRRLEPLRRRLVEGMTSLEGVRLTGHPELRLPGLASFLVAGVQGESLVMRLDEAGVGASTGTACSTGTGHPSHVLRAMGWSGTNALRFSLGRGSTMDDVEFALEATRRAVAGLRAMAPHV